MWARASNNYLKAPGLTIAAFRTCAGLGSVGSYKDNKSSLYDPRMFKIGSSVTSTTCDSTVRDPQMFSVGWRSFSSQARGKFGYDSYFNVSSKTFLSSRLLKAILDVPDKSIGRALDKYFMRKVLDPDVFEKPILCLRRCKLFKKVLLVSEWLEGRPDVHFTVRDYAKMLDLIAKVRGHQKAESYINDIPESLRQEPVYRTLLANYVSATLVTKSERLFNEMKNLGFPLSCFTFNQMILLYKKSDKRKISDVLSLMQKENIKPTLVTYQILIDVKGVSKDIQGIDQIVEQMIAEGLEPSVRMQANLAKYYAAAGFAEKAKSVLKDLERNSLLTNSNFIRSLLLPIYADLGNDVEVDRIWKVAEKRSPQQAEFLAGIGAYGKLKNVEQAEAIFEKLKQQYKKVTSRYYAVMLKVYAENKMLSKGRKLLKQMAKDGFYIGQLGWDSLVKLYVDAGEVDKADSVLQRATQHDKYLKPMFTSYMAILHAYSERGDVHNAERIFQKMQLAGYVTHAEPFCDLVQTYINAKVPAYGMEERMRGGNLYPNKRLTTLLALLDSFNKTVNKNAVFELLD